MANTTEVGIWRLRLRRATTALAALAAFGLGAVAIPSAKAQSVSVLYSFAGAPDGANPEAALFMDKAGNLYGTAFAGGASGTGSPEACIPIPSSPGCGTVFKLDSSGNETVLHSFTNSPEDGALPEAGLIMDKAGNLYGTTCCGGVSGNGTVFKLDTSGNETVLYSFTGSGGDGALPSGGLIMDKAGNLYGTTGIGGASGYGTVFKLDSSGNETVLYSFTNSPDGAIPYAGVIMDKAGNLYGVTVFGGASGYGTAFRLDTFGNETVLHSFTGGDGYEPIAGLIMDKAGNLYGTTALGGATFISGVSFGYGTVFKLDSAGNETVLHSFTNSGDDGATPFADLIRDKAGNLFGTTFAGGASNAGTVFKLDSSGNETVLYSFTGSGGDGAGPVAGLIMDKAANLYGTTKFGGASGLGTVFKLLP
jgi:uncharacterized repeat protein (TIGR03803 family)